jgi:hypothetical protein
MKIFSLAVQIIHLLLVAFVTFFPLLTDKYDVYYFISIFCVVLHWNIFNGECIASYYEKKFIDPNYNFGDAHESLFKQILGKKTTDTLIFSNVIVVMFILYRNYGKPSFKTILIITVFIFMLFYTATKIKFKKINFNS